MGVPTRGPIFLLIAEVTLLTSGPALRRCKGYSTRPLAPGLKPPCGDYRLTLPPCRSRSVEHAQSNRTRNEETIACTAGPARPGSFRSRLSRRRGRASSGAGVGSDTAQGL